MKNLTSVFFILLTTALLTLFCSLGFWQLHRAQTKEALIETYQKRGLETPLISLPENTKDHLFRQGKLSGHFIPASWILLDNKIHEKKVGYEVYALFNPEHSHAVLLVDLGFTPAENRRTLPHLPALNITVIHGFFADPPRYFALGDMLEEPNARPLKVQFIDLKKLEHALHRKLYPAVFILNRDTPLQYSWQAHTILPEKHRGYAFQWFAIAFTLLLLFLTLFFRKKYRNPR